MKLLKKRINNKSMSKRLYVFLFIIFFILCCSHFAISRAGIQINDKIEIIDGKITGQLKGLERQAVLRILAQKAGIEIIGIENVNGVIENLELMP